MPNAVPKQPPLTLSQYAGAASETDRFAKVSGGTSKLTFGFFGEVGGLLAALKKVNRDQLLESETEVAGEEIGDALWYLVAMSAAQNVDPQQLGQHCLASLRKRFNECDHDGHGAVSFRQIDGIIDVHGSDLALRRVELLSELARMSGEVVGHGTREQLSLGDATRANQFGQLLAVLGLVCASFLLKLEDVARDNLVKIHGRWPGSSRAYRDAFDNSFPEHERLPRILPIEFIERGQVGSTYVVQRLNGVHVGDRLTDNSNEADDYRFHDVFHLAYVAHLGWSPVIRSLLKLKRKSNAAVDENEDGARAMIIEEGIATWIFNHAKRRRFYEDVEPGKLDYGLLKQVHSMVSGYEVDSCPLWQRLATLGREAHLVYCARSRSEAAFLAEIEAIASASDTRLSLRCHFDGEQGGPPDLERLLAGHPPDAHFYCCGPGPMLDAYERACERLGQHNVHLERFAATTTAPPATPASGYTVELRRSGRTVQVPPGIPLLDALIEAGLNPDHSCREGVCGACETRVISGDVDHRDQLLSKQERAANKSMMICVSSCRSGCLVLDA